jgi:predicted nucleotidyltransferase
MSSTSTFGFPYHRLSELLPLANYTKKHVSYETMRLFQDFKDLLEAFAASGVEFVLLGGYAVIFYGRPRATKALDVLVGLDEENRARLGDALDAFGAASNVIDAARHLQADEVVYFGVPPLRVDILGSASGIDFAEVHMRATSAAFDGVPLKIIALDDLITNKRASGRPRDLEDCEELEKIRARVASDS